MNPLSLTVDMPWKRMCVSNNVADKEICDSKFPYRWRSSIAEIIIQLSKEQQKNNIIEVTPAFNTYITPHAKVLLKVSIG